jgi:hypothetical protein
VVAGAGDEGIRRIGVQPLRGDGSVVRTLLAVGGAEFVEVLRRERSDGRGESSLPLLRSGI